jgi:membrane protein
MKMPTQRGASRAALREVSLFLLAAVGIASLDRAATAAGNPAEETDFLPRREWRDVARRILARISEAHFPLTAAGVAFYAFLAIFPSIAVFVSLYGLFTDPSTVQAQTDAIERMLPPEAAKLLSDALRGFLAKNKLELNAALTISFILALWSARAGVSALMSALNIAFQMPEHRGYFAQQVIAIGMTLAAILLGIALVVAMSVIPLILNYLPPAEPTRTLVAWARWPVLAILVSIGFATIYRFAPCRPNSRWRISMGSIAATAMWIVGSALFSVYISMSTSYDAIYGSLTAVVVMLLWLWVSALVLLSGAVIDAERERPV